MPATFSTALPAIATITMPANACEMCSVSIAGSSADDEPLGHERRAERRDDQHRDRAATAATRSAAASCLLGVAHRARRDRR